MDRKNKVSNIENSRLPNRIRFGSSVYPVQRPDEAITKRNIKAGQRALSRAMVKITKPGIVIKPKKGVPLYYADPEQKGIIIRKLNKTLEKGIFKNGKFIKCP